jgi:hypothetical protein
MQQNPSVSSQNESSTDVVIVEDDNSIKNNKKTESQNASINSKPMWDGTNITIVFFNPESFKLLKVTIPQDWTFEALTIYLEDFFRSNQITEKDVFFNEMSISTRNLNTGVYYKKSIKDHIDWSYHYNDAHAMTSANTNIEALKRLPYRITGVTLKKDTTVRIKNGKTITKISTLESSKSIYGVSLEEIFERWYSTDIVKYFKKVLPPIFLYNLGLLAFYMLQGATPPSINMGISPQFLLGGLSSLALLLFIALKPVTLTSSYKKNVFEKLVITLVFGFLIFSCFNSLLLSYMWCVEIFCICYFLLKLGLGFCTYHDHQKAHFIFFILMCLFLVSGFCLDHSIISFDTHNTHVFIALLIVRFVLMNALILYKVKFNNFNYICRAYRFNKHRFKFLPIIPYSPFTVIKSGRMKQPSENNSYDSSSSDYLQAYGQLHKTKLNNRK